MREILIWTDDIMSLTIGSGAKELKYGTADFSYLVLIWIIHCINEILCGGLGDFPP